MTTRQWLVTTNGAYDFNNPADWQFGLVPSAIDIAQFSTGVVDTITGNATIAGIVAGSGNFALAGTSAISGTQPTELTVNGSLTILPGASIIGNQAVSVNGPAFLVVQGTLVAGSLSIAHSFEARCASPKPAALMPSDDGAARSALPSPDPSVQKALDEGALED